MRHMCLISQVEWPFFWHTVQINSKILTILLAKEIPVEFCDKLPDNEPITNDAFLQSDTIDKRENKKKKTFSPETKCV